MSDLASIITRLESAKGRDWSLNMEIERAFSPPAFSMARDYTGSIDAAIALMGRVLPGSGWIVGSGRESPSEPLGGAAIYRGLTTESGKVGEGEAITPAIALCLAICSAVQAQRAAKEHT